MMMIIAPPFLLIFGRYGLRALITLSVIYFGFHFLTFIWAVAFWSITTDAPADQCGRPERVCLGYQRHPVVDPALYPGFVHRISHPYPLPLAGLASIREWWVCPTTFWKNRRIGPREDSFGQVATAKPPRREV